MGLFDIFENKIKLKNLKYCIKIYGELPYPLDVWERKQTWGNGLESIFKKYFDLIIIEYCGKDIGKLTHICIIGFNSNIKYKKSSDQEEIQNILLNLFNKKIITKFIFSYFDNTYLETYSIEPNFTEYSYKDYLKYANKSRIESGETSINIIQGNICTTIKRDNGNKNEV